jgi:sugar phosphate isomerase/epimerase
MFSLSTCWNSHRHTDGRAMLREIRELGFEYAELSHGTHISLMPGILDAVAANEIKISTLHNFCPLPMGVNGSAPNLYKFSAEKERERELAMRHTLKTLEFAERVGASLVVLHMGCVEMKDYTRKLLDLVAEGQHGTPKYQMLCAEADEKREGKKGPFVERAYGFLRQLIPEAEKRGLRLGIENREALEEIPFDSDYPGFFREFTSPAVSYWHDTGHAQIKENMGFISHLLQLESLQDRLGGFHIHDVQPPGRDHCAPGTGCIDFAALRPFVRPGHIKVFEFNPSLAPEELKAGANLVKKLWGGE